MTLLYPNTKHRRQAWSAHRILALRRQLGLTQAQFAVRVGCSEATITRWERSQAAPSPVAQRALTRLARPYGPGEGSEPG